MKLSSNMSDVDLSYFLWYQYKLSYLAHTYDKTSKNSVFKFSKRWIPSVIYLPIKNEHNRIIELRFE